MKTGEAGKLLDTSHNTIRAWIDRPELNKFFSKKARGEGGGAHRSLTQDDFHILNTIRHLRHVEKVEDWQAIATMLDSGKIITEFPEMVTAADKRTVPIQHAEQSARAAATLAERDAALARVDELQAEIDKIRQDHKAETDGLHTELRRLEREIGRLMALLEMKGKGE